jgi:WD40 repeat protein
MVLRPATKGRGDIPQEPDEKGTQMTLPLSMKDGGVLRSIGLIALLALCTQAAFSDTISTPLIQYSSGVLTSNIAYSPDGAEFLGGTTDGKAQILDISTGAVIRTFAGHTGAVRSVAFSPDGTKVLTGSDDTTAKLWDAGTGALIRTFTGHTGAVRSVAVSPDGTKVLTGSLDTTAKLWNASTGAVIRTVTGHKGALQTVAFSPDGTKAFTGKVWNVTTGAVICDIGSYYCAAFSPDGTKVLTGASDNTATLWNATTGASIRSLLGHTDRVFSVAFSPDGTKALTGSNDYTAKLWDVATGEFVRSFRGHTQTVSSVRFSPDGTKVLTGSGDCWYDEEDPLLGDCTVKLWSTETGAVTRTFTEYSGLVTSVAFSPDGTKVLTGSWDRRALLRGLASKTVDRTFFSDTDRIDCVAFTPDGTKVVTGSSSVGGPYGQGASPTVKLWDVSAGTVIRSIPTPGGVQSLAISPDGTKAVTGLYYVDVRLWDLNAGTELRSFIGESAAFSPDGTKVLTGWWEIDPVTQKAYGVTKLFNASTGALVRTLSGQDGSVTSVAFSPDGTQILTGTGNGTTLLWTATGTHLITFVGQTGTVASVAFSPDGTKVLTGSDDMTAKLWNAATGAEIRTFNCYASMSYNPVSVAFSPDGTKVLTGAYDGTTKLWPVAGASASVAVPNVAGQTQAAAQTAIAAAGLTAGTVTQQSSTTVSAGLVINPSPAAGTQVAFGSAVDLVVSSGPPPAITGSIVINNNRSATNNPQVTLALTWSGGAGTGVTRMRFSNDGATWSAWEALTATRAYALPGTDGYKTVRVQYRDSVGNNSPVFNDYIRLDATPPTGSININNGASTTATQSVTLGLTWADGTGAGVSRMRFSDNGSTWTAWMPLTATRAHTLPAGLGYHTVRVQYLDGANNYSAVYNDYIKLVTP